MGGTEEMRGVPGDITIIYRTRHAPNTALLRRPPYLLSVPVSFMTAHLFAVPGALHAVPRAAHAALGPPQEISTCYSSLVEDLENARWADGGVYVWRGQIAWDRGDGCEGGTCSEFVFIMMLGRKCTRAHLRRECAWVCASG